MINFIKFITANNSKHLFFFWGRERLSDSLVNNNKLICQGAKGTRPTERFYFYISLSIIATTKRKPGQRWWWSLMGRPSQIITDDERASSYNIIHCVCFYLVPSQPSLDRKKKCNEPPPARSSERADHYQPWRCTNCHRRCRLDRRLLYSINALLCCCSLMSIAFFF